MRRRCRVVAAIACAALLGAAWLGCASRRGEPVREQAARPTGDAGAHVLKPAASSEAAERDRTARLAAQDARAFLIQDRPEAALRAAARGLFAQPDDPALLRERARALEALGREAEAADARARADRIDPPPPPLPDGPLAGSFTDLLVIMQAPELDFASARAVTEARSAVDLKPALIARLEQRLPGVAITEETDATAGSVPDARAWLASHDRSRIAGVRIVRAFCGESVKDGRYAVATIYRTEAEPQAHVGQVEQDARAEQQNAAESARDPGDTIVDGPVRWSGARADEDDTETCALTAMHRALEAWLDAPFFDAGHRDAHAPDAAPNALSRETILGLLPELHARVQAEHASARRALFVGDLERARAAYERAAALDPEDADVWAHIEEIDATITLNRELARVEAQRRSTQQSAGSAAADAAERGAWLPAELTPAQRAALESQLEGERRRRDDLLATLATVSGDRRSAHVPEAALRTTELLDPQAPGPRRALAQLDTNVSENAAADAGGALAVDRLVVKTLHAPSGALLARYYFDAAAITDAHGATPPAPLLVEEDVSGDGAIDRWTSYRAGYRTAVWERRREEGLPDLHADYADDGRALVRLELDDGLDGQADRIYEYERGLLVRSAQDTDGDGWLDRFDTFDADGRVASREEDVTGDRRIDVRSTFVDGRLVKRELMEPEQSDAKQ